MTTFDVAKFICFIYALISTMCIGVYKAIVWLANHSNQSNNHPRPVTAGVYSSSTNYSAPTNYSALYGHSYDNAWHSSTTADGIRRTNDHTRHYNVNQSHKKCINPSCKKMRWRDDYGYCSVTCMKRHRRHSSTVVRRASPESFQKVEEYFIKRWHRNKGSCGELKKVLIINNRKLQDQFDKYLSLSLDKTAFMCYHGTSLRCPIYDNITTCDTKTCGVCGIIQNGFLTKFISANIPYQRFGDAFYFAVNSSKSHDYTQGHGEYRAMLLCKVAVGKRFITQSNHCDLKIPPSGYDSVHGRHGGTLNYDEIVVYNPEAVLPTHVLLYKKDGIHKIAR